MKKTILPFLALFICLAGFSQHMQVRENNFVTLDTAVPVKIIPAILESRSSAKAKANPEYGILPFNAQCKECVELIDRRTLFGRRFVDIKDSGLIYSQKSYFPLHYKKKGSDAWTTIDPRLKADSTKQGIYTALNQPAPTKCDLNKKTTSLFLGKYEFEFNKDISLYFFDEDKAYLKPEKANYDHYTVGDEGVKVKNIWQDIDMEHVFRAGEIETNFIIKKRLKLPIDKGYMVIEEHFSLPDSLILTEAPGGTKLDNGYFQGDYQIRDTAGNLLMIYAKPQYYDLNSMGMQGLYNIKRNGHDYTLQVLVPIQWLNMPGNAYPLVIDPTALVVYGITKQGDYTATPGGVFYQYGFTTRNGSCNIHDSVEVDGKTSLLDAYVTLEWVLTFDHTCGNPPEPNPFCTITQITQEVINDTCGTSSGVLSCRAAPQGQYYGTCTTDSAEVPGAAALRITSFSPNFLTCITPQCPDYIVHFTLESSDSICGDSCGYLCARGHLWGMTVSAHYLIGNMSVVGYPANQTNITVCQGQSIDFTANGQYGVPPYHYLWTKDGGNTYDTTYHGAYTLTAIDTNGYSLTCVVVDTCGITASTTVYNIIVLTAPPANAGADKYVCEGGMVTIGGNPVTVTPNTVVGWEAENAMALSWLSDTSALNPTVTVPAGTLDTVFYTVRTTNTYCNNTDTVLVYSIPNPVVTIDSAGSTAICPGQYVELIATANIPAPVYEWSNGSVDSTDRVGTPGSYYAVVTDPRSGCVDTSNSIAVTNIGPPVFSIFPDTTIHVGDSVTLSADISLSPPAVDSFYWSPLVNLSCSTCANPVASPVLPQQYNLTVYKGGCSTSDSLLVQVLLPTNFYIPNAFTPDRAGENDQFYIFSQSGVKVISFQVFDRIGEKVHDGAYPWDGTYRGKPAPQGVYVYDFTISLFGSEATIFRKGSVTLIR